MLLQFAVIIMEPHPQRAFSTIVRGFVNLGYDYRCPSNLNTWSVPRMVKQVSSKFALSYTFLAVAWGVCTDFGVVSDI